jgi:hypothetical protein
LSGFYEPACKTVFVRNITPSLRKIRKAPLLLLLPAIGPDALLDRKSDFGLGFLFGLQQKLDGIENHFELLRKSRGRPCNYAFLIRMVEQND